jgi:Fic-DOC domain mobile mystery protein B
MSARFQPAKGATPIDDADGLLIDAETMAELSAAEAGNILKAFAKHLKRRHDPKRAWLTDDYLRQAHRDMFEDVWEWAGRYRETALSIGVEPASIREEIGRLCGDVAFWDAQAENPLPVLERAAKIHHRLTWIHPFKNGNGRHARLIADVYLRAHGRAIPIWPSVAADGAPREEYLAAIKEGDRQNFEPLIALIRKYLPE